MNRTVSDKSLVLQATVWLALPMVIFLAGWFVEYVSIPVIFAIIFFIYKMWRTPSNKFLCDRFEPVRIDRMFWIILLCGVLYVVWSGIGALVTQTRGDAVYRNAVFYDLARRPWPVTYPPLEGGDGQPRMLCYYIGFFLPGALVSKLTGFIAPGDFTQFLYAAWGMALILQFFFSLTGGKARWSVFLVFIFFGAWDILMALWFDEPLSDRYGRTSILMLDLASDLYSIPTASVLFFYVYHQGIGAVIATMLCWHERHRVGNLLFLYSLMLITAPYPAIGMFPVMAIICFRNLREAVSVPNAVGLVIAALTASYMAGNARTGAAEWVVPHYLVFCFFTVTFFIIGYLPYIILLWTDIKKNTYFWVTLAFVLLLPICTDGGSWDIGYRISIPLVTMMMVLTMRMVINFKGLTRFKQVWLCIVLIIGSWTDVATYIYQFSDEKARIEGVFDRKDIWMMSQLDRPDINPCYNNFVCEGETFYTRHLMPR